MKTEISDYPKISHLILSLVILDNVLILLGLVFYPPVLQEGGLLGAGAAVLMVCFYGYLALYSPISLSRVVERVWRTGAAVGVVGGTWLGLDLLSNYFIYRDGPTNTRISLVVYGVYFLLLLGTAVYISVQAGSFKDGLTGAIWYVLIAQLIWLAVEFGAYYLFSRTAVGAQFIQTEMGADFVRSGGGDFQAFVMSDIFGAGFFHLLLIGLLAGLAIGALGAAIGRWISPRRRQGSTIE